MCSSDLVASSASAGAVTAAGPAGPSSTIREQVSETVSENRNGGPAVEDQAPADDPEATTEVRRDDLAAVTQQGSESEPADPDAEATQTVAVGPVGPVGPVGGGGHGTDAAPESPLKAGMMVGGR